MNSFVNFILARAKERTTWVGVIGVASALGVTLKPDLAEAIASLGVAVASLVLMITTDMTKKPDEPKGE